MKRAALCLLLTLAAAAGGQERAPTATFTRVEQPLPRLQTLAPDHCLTPGANVQVRGEYFGERNRWPLVLVSGRVQLPVVVQAWSDRQISLRLPARTRLAVADRWQLGFYPDGRWHGQPLSGLRLCVEPATLTRTTVSEPSPAAPRPPTGVPPAPPAQPTTPAPVREEPESEPVRDVPAPVREEPVPVREEPTLLEPAIAPSGETAAAPAPPSPVPETRTVEPGAPVETGQNVDSTPVVREAPVNAGPGHTDTGPRLLDMPLPAEAPTAPVVSDSDYEPGEVVVTTTTMAEAQAVARALASQGIRIKSRKSLPALELVITVLRLPASAQVPSVVAEVSGRFPEAIVDANHRYRLQDGGAKTWGLRQIDWQSPSPGCTGSIKLGVMDTLAEEQHPALAATPLINRAFIGREPAANTDHGTALAVLLAGQPEAGFASLLPGASVRVAGVFRQRGDEVDTTTEYLLDGLNWLLEEEVGVINLSLGGARNRVLERALANTRARGVGLVAAAGNSGPESAPVYPAAQSGVVAVTAVDARGSRYRHANTGDYIDIAAPGVDVWVANGRGQGAFRSGSSYATAFVTALVALHGADIDLAAHSRDLGEPGRDDSFGWGLLRWSDCPGAVRSHQP